MIFETSNTYVALIEEVDLNRILEIYNSNKGFLLSHMDKESVDTDWVRNELDNMRSIGFNSCKIIEKRFKRTIGFVEFAVKKESYLSLLMIHNNFKDNGYGKEVFYGLENYLKENFSDSIRIDIVTDYDSRVFKFWSELGFRVQENIILNWADKELSAIVMKKYL
ncbi:acetyltransferase [Caloranaerobacter sp. TR13]|uniref:GNAT family N-acetyltransferase n=1 Tax=Caloranaerobacter sp. TR13 TaxID=1302151 RepID=UPI0006D40189|nr:GNAT family N-acetyltransferase [Caloranaerobacter sp. TR13]KPU28348.1 acetyltransferase [Caloranaerobacter sp. TR13]